MKEQAFAIYHEGDLYTHGSRTVYKTISSAKGVVTHSSKAEARHHWEANHPGKYWYDLPLDERRRLADMYAEQHFKIMEYGPVKQVWPS